MASTAIDGRDIRNQIEGDQRKNADAKADGECISLELTR
jgi:hypothetical protein